MARKLKAPAKSPEEIAAEEARAAEHAARWARVEAIKSEPRVDLFAAELQTAIDELKADLDKWTEEFRSNPAYALEWGRDVFATAAKWKLYVCIKNELPDAANGARVKIQGIVDYLQRIMIQRARSAANRSTSATSNLMDDYTLQAMAEAVEDWSGIRYKASLAAQAEVREQEAAATPENTVEPVNQKS